MTHDGSRTDTQGRAPSPADRGMIRRLNDSFGHVELDVSRLHASCKAAWIIWHARAPRTLTTKTSSARGGRLGTRVYVVLADNTNPDLAYLSFLLEPEHDRIFIGYESGDREDASRELLSASREFSTMRWSLSDQAPRASRQSGEVGAQSRPHLRRLWLYLGG